MSPYIMAWTMVDKVAAVYYDFNMVDPEILQHNLQFYGIMGNSYRLIESFLQIRKQFVQANNSCSGMKRIKYKIPEGSVLGLIQLTIYLNYIANIKLDGKKIIYADDMSLLYTYSHDAVLKIQIQDDVK